MIRRHGLGCAAAIVLGFVVVDTGPLGAQVIINEVLASNCVTMVDEDGDSSDWIEIHNASADEIDLTGYGLSDDEGEPRKWTFPELVIPAGGYVVTWCSGKDRKTLPLDKIDGPESTVPFLPSFVSEEDEWRYLTRVPAAGGPPGDWNEVGFDDGQWQSGKPMFGFGNDDVVTLLPEGTGAVFLRRVFTVRTKPESLILEARFDDGFVAFLNGVEVASVNRPEEELTFASIATRSHSASRAERFDLTEFVDALQIGENVLALVMLNRRATSNDFSMAARLGTVPPMFHTNFRLNRGGEIVVLADARGDIVDQVEYPAQSPDESYGRQPDGTGAFLFNINPTPGAANAGPANTSSLVVAAIEFSPDHGIYDAPFDVTITTETPGAEIRYTTDGSAPTATTGTVYAGPIGVKDTTVFRAAAFKLDHRPSPLSSSTYVFFETPEGGGVLNQPPDPPAFPRTWGSAGAADYGMDARVATDKGHQFYDPHVKEGLLALPSLSIIMDNFDLFDPRTGIYANPQQQGVAWERPCSVELFYPDERKGFRINCGLRIQGGASRNPNRPKHNMRLLFKKIYGPGKLEFPFFDDTHITSFDTIILRGGNGDSWFHPNATQQQRAQYIRDQWHRDTQMTMGRLSPHQNYTHLYINGLYWGMYHNFERPNAAFLASYLGGEEEDYDALNLGEPVDGDLDAWNEMMRIARGGMSTPEAYAEIQEYLDVPNLIDFLLINFYSGNIDWDHNNWYAGRRRAPGAGYKFFCWDAERSFWSPSENRTTINNANRPTSLHRAMKSNLEYRTLVGDHVHRHFFNGGALAEDVNDARWMARAREIEVALSSESARWGDNKRPNRPYKPDVEWVREIDNIRTNYLKTRTQLLRDQLRSDGFYPNVAAPVFNQHGGRVPEGFSLVIHVPEGEVYYTTDESDPRLAGGAVSPQALTAPTPERVELLAVGAPARVLVPTDGSLGLDWIAPDFDDGAWTLGATGVGFERGEGYEELIVTDVGDQMYEKSGSVYLRIEFDVDDPASLSFLTLRMMYDDGFIAYLNGVQVSSSNAPEDPQWDSTATRSNSDRSAVEFADFELAPQESQLRAGRNVLAIHAMNLRARDGDLLVIPALDAFESRGGLTLHGRTVIRARALVGEEWSALNAATFLVGDPPPLSATEIMYNPAPPPEGSPFDAQDFEFIELQNVGAEPVDVSEFKLSGAIEFDFSVSNTFSVAPGAFVLIVKDREAFASRYDTRLLTIAGEYRRNLSNNGEAIVLIGAEEETVFSFEYDDAWYPETDGAGHSLVLADIISSPDTWSESSSWRPSEAPGGSPGDADAGGGPPPAPSRQRPSDVNQDGQLNLTDAVKLLERLFAESTDPLPCAGAISEGGNLVVHDFNGDGSVNVTDAVGVLAYLFNRGDPPAPGTECVPAEGCRDSCGQ